MKITVRITLLTDKKSIFAYAVMIFAFVGTAFLNFNVLIVLIICAAAGLGTYYAAARGTEK